MASGTPQDSHHRKHRRSSDEDEVDKISKRHKHRHHKRHHRHHRSKKQEQETKQVSDEIVPLPSFPSVRVGGRVDDEVEEGEILEEEGVCEVAMRKSESDAESGEIKAVPVRDSIPLVEDYREPVLEHESKNDADAVILDVKGSVNSMTESSYNTNEALASQTKSSADPPNETISRDARKGHVYDEVGRKSCSDDRQNEEIGASLRKRDKHRSNHGVGRMQLDQKLVSSKEDSFSSDGFGEEKMTSTYLSSKDKCFDDVYDRSRSRSCDIDRARSRSQSITEDDALVRRRHCYEREAIKDRLYSSLDLVQDEERLPSSTRLRYFEEGMHHSRDTLDRGMSRERDTDRDRKKQKERGRGRSGDIDVDWRREKDHVRSRDWEMDGGRKSERSEEERNRDRYIDKDHERKREKEQDRGRDRERKREKERDQSRDRLREREREREKDRNRDRDIVRRRSSEREREREREKRNDRNRSRATDIVDNREKHKKHEVGHFNEGRLKHSRHPRSDEADHYHDTKRKTDSSKVRSSHSDPMEESRHKFVRDENDQDDFEENVSFELPGQEEEDLDRIKEESRKRRQAILEKYKNKKVQQNHDSASEVEEKGNLGTSVPVATVLSDVHDGNKGVDIFSADPLLVMGNTPSENGIAASERGSGAAGLGEGTPKSERSNDMFRDDIFGESPTGVRKAGKDDLPVIRSALHDNWDDAEGYYSYRFGELLDGRYEVISAHGKGVFSTVVRAKDLKAGNDEPEEVAIKIIRNNETMHKAGQTEVQILKNLAAADPESKRHCVRFLSSFKYRNHLCLVFESLHMNLREVLKKFGRNIGLKLTAVRAYAKQLFIALKHLKNCGILHSDIKPDNMLVNEAKNVLKLCDFGNAMTSGKNEITPYLVSRFYRAPEIILGLNYDHPMDIWSVGCCLYELYAGKVLFPGATNNDMLRLHMELKGPFPKKMLRKGAFIDQHFDHDLNFYSTEEDLVTKKIIKRIVLNIKAKDIGSVIFGGPGEDPKMLTNFRDMLEKIFVLDPEKRMTVSQALAHPFITGK